MVRRFRGKATRAFFEGGHPKRFRAIEMIATGKLAMLDAAKTLDFMRSAPGNRLEALKGDRAGRWSVGINGQWSVCFATVAADFAFSPAHARLVARNQDQQSGGEGWGLTIRLIAARWHYSCRILAVRKLRRMSQLGQ